MKQLFAALAAGIRLVPTLAYATFICFALACALRADPVTVNVRPAPTSGSWVNGAPTTLAAQRGK